jgi:tetratricopeptide (TPR) repeat protein
MKNYSLISNLGFTKLTFIRVIVFLFVFIGFTTTSKAQFFDELSNPQVSVKIDHAPGLGLKINKVSFNTATGNCADQIITALQSDFVSNNVEVIDRENLTTILKEHDFTFSGYVDQTTAAAIGKIIGPSALVTVKVLRCETKIQDNLYAIEKRHNYNNNTDYQVKVLIARTSVFLKVSIQTTDLTTGRIFTAKVFDYSPVKENKSEVGQPETPAEFDVQEIAFNSLVGDVHKLFFPWSERLLLYFFDDKDDGLKQAFQALSAGNIDQTFNLSVQNLETCKKSTDIKPKILAHAYYNLGMSYMIRSEYDSAIQNFQEAQKLRPGTIITNSIAVCKYSRDEAIALQKVDEKASIEMAKSQNETEKAVQTKEANTLTNADIIDLTQKKLPNSLIIQKIKTSNCKFDTSTDALVALTNAGVSEDVIMLMMEKK